MDEDFKPLISVKLEDPKSSGNIRNPSACDHPKSSATNQPFPQCNICDLVFNLQFCLLKCHLCDMTLNNKTEFASHFQIIHGFDSNLQARNDSEESDYEEDSEGIEDPLSPALPTATILCNWCEMGFDSLDKVRAHRINAHQCKYCKTHSKNKNKHHSTCPLEKKTAICETCGKGFSSQLGLDIHFRRAHSQDNSLGPVYCPVCYCAYPSQTGLRVHYKKGECGKMYKLPEVEKKLKERIQSLRNLSPIKKRLDAGEGAMHMTEIKTL